jgi:hypothetical protein
MLEWNKSLKAGQLSPKEYKNKINNVKEYWGELATTAKSFDDRYMQQMERQRNGDSSGLETYGLEKLADFQNIESKSVYVDETTGRILLSNTDEEGRYVGEPIDINHINNPGNIVDNRVDLNSEVSEKVKNWKVFQQFDLLKKGATQSIEDVRLNPKFNQAVNELSYSLLYTPNAVASVMSDNGVAGKYEVGEISFPIEVDFFMDEAEKGAKVQEQIERIKMLNENVDADIDEGKLKSEIEKYMIEVRRDANGTMRPVITEDQRDIAKDRIQREVEMQLGHKEKKTPAYKPTSTGSRSGGGVKSTDDKKAQLYVMVQDALGGNSTGLRPGFKYDYTSQPGKLVIEPQKGMTGEMMIQLGLDPGTEVIDLSMPTAAEEVARYAGTTTPANAASDYGYGMQLVQGGYVPMARRGQSNTNTGSYVGVPEGGF